MSMEHYIDVNDSLPEFMESTIEEDIYDIVVQMSDSNPIDLQSPILIEALLWYIFNCGFDSINIISDSSKEIHQRFISGLDCYGFTQISKDEQFPTSLNYILDFREKDLNSTCSKIVCVSNITGIKFRVRFSHQNCKFYNKNIKIHSNGIVDL